MPTSPSWPWQSEDMPRSLANAPAVDPNYVFKPSSQGGNAGADWQQVLARIKSGQSVQEARSGYNAAHTVGGGGLLGHIGHALSTFGGNAVGAAKGLVTQAPSMVGGGARDWVSHFLGTPEGRKQLAIVAAAGLGSMAATGSFGAAGAAGAEAGGGAVAGGGSAAAGAIDPFAADAGLGTAWGSVGAGGGAIDMIPGAGNGSYVPGPNMPAASGSGFYDPSGTFHAGTAGGDFGVMAGGGGAAAPSWYNSPWGQTAIRGGAGLALNQLFGGQTGAERSQSNLANASFEDLQKFLPPELRSQFSGDTLKEGLAKLAELIKNPGGLSPTVNEAIAPRLAAESQSIAQNYRNLQSNQAGAAARGNLPVSIKGALQSALDVAQERAQRGARGEALVQSETMRRQDLQQVYNLLDTILQFVQSGRGAATAGLGAAAQSSAQRQAATLALIANLLQAHGTGTQGY